MKYFKSWSMPHLSKLEFAVLTLAFVLTVVKASEPVSVPVHSLMPAPAELRFATGRLPVNETFQIAVRGCDDARLRAGIERALQRWEKRTGLKLAGLAAAPTPPTLIVECAGAGSAVPKLGDDESYLLDITPSHAVLRAPTIVGGLRGWETLLQLLQHDSDGFYLPSVKVIDRPRFPWRGLMIDVARHWQPIEVIKRNLDGMALVKLNVLHLHLTDDHGFRIESRTHPELQARGSDGQYFTQEEMRDIIAYAQMRGIRVVPEFDIPAHTASWVVSHPELAGLPGPYAIERRLTAFNPNPALDLDPVLDPTNEALYTLLDDFLGEMATLFPDACIHIGGDENDGVQWNANPRIQAFIHEHDLKDNGGLQAYFNRRVAAILASHGKRLIGWDEILHPDLPQDAVIQSWRGPESLATAVRQGYCGILSSGYYIDLMQPAAGHYLNDPLPATTTLTVTEQQRILGGEATMWSEWVTPETIDSRIWPRTAAIAERLWSPREVCDVDDMYRRLAVISVRLEEAGLLQEKNYGVMLRRLAGDRATGAEVQALRTLVDIVEPVKDYRRGALQPRVVQSTPLTGLVDCARPDSAVARTFAASVNRFLFQPGALDPGLAGRIIEQLGIWNSTGRDVADHLAGKAPALKDAAVVAQALADISAVGQDAVQALLSGHAPDNGWVRTRSGTLHRAEEFGSVAVEFPILPSLKLLVVAAAEQDKRNTLQPEAWRQYLRTITFPSKQPTN